MQVTLAGTRARVAGRVGVAHPPFRDAHVHLGLVDEADRAHLALHGIAAVVDLGWSAEIATLAAPVQVAFAGRFLTEPGGYPSDRAWAPHASIREVTRPAEAAAAVRAQVDLGATVVKVTLNREAGPVPDLATLSAVVAAAGELPVVAHAEGAGMVELALAAGVAVLAHTPWTHRIDDAVVAEAIAAGQSWISTLDIHGYGEPTPDRSRAIDNLARFHAAGGVVRYGTDLGNGPLPAGVNPRELAALADAGLDETDILGALCHDWPLPPPGDVATFVPDPDLDTRTGSAFADRLAGAVVVPREELEEIP